MSLREEVAELLSDLYGPRGEDARCALLSMRAALPLVAEAYTREPQAARRQAVIHCLWQYRNLAALPTLRTALHDPADCVWKEALDGLVTLGGGAVQRVLHEEWATLAQTDKAGVKRDWIAEALAQIGAKTS